jgi:hypothetical protein
MKKHFHHLDITPLLTQDIENPLIHCIRCGDEYPMLQLLCGYREGESELFWYCKHDDCYGKYPSDIFIITITKE